MPGTPRGASPPGWSAHGDDAGIVVPPKLAPYHVVVVPIFRKEEERPVVMEKAAQIAGALRDMGHRVHVDARDNMTPGAKYYEWERKGVPVRMEIGPRDVAKGQVVLVQRRVFGDEPRKEFLEEATALGTLSERLDGMQASLLRAAVERREGNSHRGVTDYARFREIIEDAGGFVYAGWCGAATCEARVKEETKATIRVLPSEEFRTPDAPARCLVCGGVSLEEAVWARAY